MCFKYTFMMNMARVDSILRVWIRSWRARVDSIHFSRVDSNHSPSCPTRLKIIDQNRKRSHIGTFSLQFEAIPNPWHGKQSRQDICLNKLKEASFQPKNWGKCVGGEIADPLNAKDRVATYLLVQCLAGWPLFVHLDVCHTSELFSWEFHDVWWVVRGRDACVRASLQNSLSLVTKILMWVSWGCTSLKSCVCLYKASVWVIIGQRTTEFEHGRSWPAGGWLTDWLPDWLVD